MYVEAVAPCVCTPGSAYIDKILQVQGISLTLYVYQLRKDDKGNENVAVEKVTYTKPVEPAANSS